MDYNAAFETLAGNNSRLFKEEFLQRFAKDEVMMLICSLALDGLHNFYIRKIPEYVSDNTQPDKIDVNFLSNLKDFSNRIYTGHAAIDRLKSLLQSVNQADGKVIERIINRDLKCGISSSTVNKIWPNLVSEFPVMLAEKSAKKYLDKFSMPAYVQRKYDGMRFNGVCRSPGWIDIYSRNGKSYTFHDIFEKEFDKEANYGYVIDGELWVDDGTGKPLPRKIGNGIITKAGKGTISKEEAAMVRATIWDVIPIECWEAGLLEVSYEDRLKLLHKHASDKVFEIETECVNNFDEVDVLFQEALAAGDEGVMLKSKDDYWIADRVKYQIKFKSEKSADLLCVGVEPGKPGSKYESLIGSLLLETKDGLIKVNCGSGLKDEDRKKDPNEFIGKIIEIVYNERIKARGDKTEALFLPIYKCIRDDKNDANYAKDLK